MAEDPKKKRGGTRAGAGRKPQLTDMQRIAAYASYRRLWDGCVKANYDAALAKATRKARQQFDFIGQVPVHMRRDWIRRESWIEGGRRKRYDYTFADYLKDLRAALQKDQRLDEYADSEPARMLAISGRRPKGKRKQIIAQVAAEFGIKESMVEDCIKEFRACERDLERDDG